MRLTMILPAALAAILATGAARAQQLPAIDWGAAGKGEAVGTEPLPEKRDEVADDGFDCQTVTRFSSEFEAVFDRRVVAGPTDDPGPGPRQARRCSRDGVSIELSPLR